MRLVGIGSQVCEPGRAMALALATSHVGPIACTADSPTRHVAGLLWRCEVLGITGVLCHGGKQRGLLCFVE